MKQALSLALCLAWGLSAVAGEPQKLFNGKDLSGWSGNPDLWKVEGGVIVGSTVGKKIKGNTFLVWEGGEVEDFELTVEVKVEGSNNSGVQYRSSLKDPKTWRVIGYQADIHPSPNYVGMLYGEGLGRGIIAQRGTKVTVDAESGKPKVTGKAGEATPVNIAEWHEYKVVAKGNVLRHYVDGELATEITDNHKKQLKSGIIALQLHAGAPMTASFRNIVLKK